MKTILTVAAAAALAISLPSTAAAQSAAPPEAIVSIYHAAPGHQVALLKWLEQQQRVAAAAGIAPSQLYVHMDGDSWDYLVIAPATTRAQDDAMDAAARKLGVPAGPGVGIELRKHINSHTDTFAAGPMSISDYLRSIGQ